MFSPSPDPSPLTPDPLAQAPALYACVYQPSAGSAAHVLTEVAEAFSPRYERHGEQLITIDLRGLDRLLGSPRMIGEELRRDAADRGLRAHIAIARTRTAAMILAVSSPGLRVIENGQEMAALAPIPIGILEKLDHEEGTQKPQKSKKALQLREFCVPSS